MVLAAIYCALVFSIADSKEAQFDRVTVALARSMFLETRSSHWIFLFFLDYSSEEDSVLQRERKVIQC